MIRTQIQLTEQQSNKLKELAVEYDVSTAELIRRAVDQLLATAPPVYDAEQKRLALACLGQISDDSVNDLSENHDRYLAEIYAQVAEPIMP